MTVLVIAFDMLREAAARKWFIALWAVTTIILIIVGFALRLDVVDGVLSATRFFGENMESSIRSVDVAVRPVFEGAAYVIFYGGIFFGVFACAGFGPSMLSPGRIEHLLSLPVRRWELMGGTFLGVVILSLIGSVYGTGGLTIIMGIKTGYWTGRLMAAGLLASATFATVYGAMLTTAQFVRSAPVSGAVGAALVFLGILAGERTPLMEMIEPGVGRTIYGVMTAPIPRVSQVGAIAGDLAASRGIDVSLLARLLGGQLVFCAAVLALGVWWFERRDY